jgi:hypothetical protein
MNVAFNTVLFAFDLPFLQGLPGVGSNCLFTRTAIPVPTASSIFSRGDDLCSLIEIFVRQGYPSRVFWVLVAGIATVAAFLPVSCSLPLLTG